MGSLRKPPAARRSTPATSRRLSGAAATTSPCSPARPARTSRSTVSAVTVRARSRHPRQSHLSRGRVVRADLSQRHDRRDRGPAARRGSAGRGPRSSPHLPQHGIVGECAARGIPFVLTLNDYWLLCHRGQLLDLDLARCAGPEPGRCAVCAGLSASGTPALHRAARGLRLIEERAPKLLADAHAGSCPASPGESFLDRPPARSPAVSSTPGTCAQAPRAFSRRREPSWSNSSASASRPRACWSSSRASISGRSPG